MKKIIPLLLVMLGCSNVVDSVVESRLKAIADAYSNEDIEYLVNNVTENFVRHIPNDIIITGKDEYKDYLTDFFQANDNIKIDQQFFKNLIRYSKINNNIMHFYGITDNILKYKDSNI